MPHVKTLKHPLAVALAVASVAVGTMGGAVAQRGGGAELINRPAPHVSPYTCVVDEGYGRWGNCDH